VLLQKCCICGTKGSKHVNEICGRSRRSAGAAGRAEHNLVLTPRLPAAVAIFDVIAGCDPADPVTAASQGKRADSYLRFLDTDGARPAAALGRRCRVAHNSTGPTSVSIDFSNQKRGCGSAGGS
jgi:hypothetical protein